MQGQHARFLERLAGSQDAVFTVARWLHRRGKEISIPAIRFAPTAEQADAYLDGGDIYVVRRSRVEVKHLGVNFTCAADWPFGEVFVSNKASVDRGIHEIQAWVSVSKDMRFGAIVTPDTREHWYLKNVTAKNTGNVEVYYVCPLEYVAFRCIGA